MNDASAGLSETLEALRAAAEETRLRMLALLAEGELSVSDLTDILGQSQPRISRHLKLLVEAGLVERHREGAWAFFRLGERAASAQILRAILSALDGSDHRLAGDRARLAEVRAQRARSRRSAFFERLAPNWDRLRSLHAAEDEVEAAILDAVGPKPVGSLLDLGTGTGRMLQLLGPRARRAVGLDSSHAMLAVARANLEKAGLRASSCARATSTPRPSRAAPSTSSSSTRCCTISTIRPGRCARRHGSSRPAGACSSSISRRTASNSCARRQAHRRLGFCARAGRGWLAEAGLDCTLHARARAAERRRRTSSPCRSGSAEDRRVITDWPLSASNREVA